MTCIEEHMSYLTALKEVRLPDFYQYHVPTGQIQNYHGSIKNVKMDITEGYSGVHYYGSMNRRIPVFGDEL
jgi:hypothetical protein